jgi:hypothetical protein
LNNRSSRILLVVALIFGYSLVTIPVANAYMDPGSGSFIIQMLLGATLGAAVAIKVFWRRIVGFFSRKRRTEGQDSDRASGTP